MRRYLLSCCLPALLLISCTNNTPVDTYTEKQTIRFVELSYGLVGKDNEANTSSESESSDTTSEDHSMSDGFRIIEKTDTVPARLGSRFGIRYMLESNLDPSVELRKVWVFPDSVHNDDGDTYIEDAYKVQLVPNEETHASFTLEYPYEVKKGKWQLCFYYKKHLLYRKIFVLI